jgi:choline-sulfatase
MTQPANLLFFMSDNHNGHLMGSQGHPYVQTPNMDGIAARGTRFANAYCTSPLCCPSRSSLATGRYPHQTGYWDNALTYDGRLPTWHHRLREQGHDVTAIGKLHFRSPDDDNGFTEEIVPMHLHEGKGAIKNLLRGYGMEPPKDDGSFWKLYMERSGVGTTHYQDYDRKITEHAIACLKQRLAKQNKPWVLFVSYISAHPPFTVPQRLWDLYPEHGMPLPPAFRIGERPEHPAAEYLRHMDGMRVMTDEAALRRIAAGYFALITHLDEQIGMVLKAAQELGLLDTTRVAYTSDHGELFGAQGIFGKKNLYEGAIRVPLLIAGPGVPQARVVQQPASHVDLFPTLLAGAGAQLADADCDLPGMDLWPAIGGRETARTLFAEYHAQGSRAGAFVVREGDLKLIYHVGMPAQLFDLARDPDETRDLVADGSGLQAAQRLEARLRTICDPEAADARAKTDQRAAADAWGGADKLRGESQILFTPPPGVSKEEAWAIPGAR